MSEPLVSVLARVGRSKKLIDNLAACFLSQVLSDKSVMVILDDKDLLRPEKTQRFVVLKKKELTDGQKYAYLLEYSLNCLNPEFIVFWNADDVYLSWFLKSSVMAALNCPSKWSRPSEIFLLFVDELQKIKSDNCSFYSSVFSAKIAKNLVFPSDEEDYRYAWCKSLLEFVGDPGDSLDFSRRPGYVMRFFSRAIVDFENGSRGCLEPQFDEESLWLYKEFCNG